MPEHTPGPWNIHRFDDDDFEPWFRIDGDSTLFLDVHACSDGYIPGQNEANANLIAAAPDLLAALKAVLSVADRKTDEFDLARAAIAKATSGSRPGA